MLTIYILHLWGTPVSSTQKIHTIKKGNERTFQTILVSNKILPLEMEFKSNQMVRKPNAYKISENKPKHGLSVNLVV